MTAHDELAASLSERRSADRGYDETMRFDKSPPPLARALAVTIDKALTTLSRLRRAIKGYATVGRFASHGTGFRFDPDGQYTYGSITVGNEVNLGTRPTILATRARVMIGDHVMFGPNVTIRGGNHRFDITGLYIDEVTDDMKRAEDDRGVVIEGDVWIGGDATILHGVTIGRGSIIGASAVVTRNVPPYSIVGGNPARVIRARFDPDEIAEHERKLARRHDGGTAK